MCAVLLMGSQCGTMPIKPVDTDRPPVFTLDLNIPNECVILFQNEYISDSDIQAVVRMIEEKNVGYIEKVKVLLERVTYNWMKHAKLLESQGDLVSLCENTLKQHLDTIYKRHEYYCKEYGKVYSREFDKCIDKK